MRSKELKLYLSIRWTGRFGRKASAWASRLILFLEESRIPAHWILPCFPVLERAQYLPLVEEIKRRIHSQTDHLLPMGYSGAMHTMLSLPELARELQWCRHNPWGSGVRDVFEIDPSFLFPTAADLYRGKARRLYRRKGFTGIVAARQVTGQQPFRAVIGSGPGSLAVTSLPILAVEQGGAELPTGRLFTRGESVGEARGGTRGESLRMLLLLDLDSRLWPDESDVTENLKDLLGQLSRRMVLSFHRLLGGAESFQRNITASETREIDPTDGVYAYDLHADPLSRRLGAAALALRGRGEPTGGRHRALLRKMAAHRLLADAPRRARQGKSFPDPLRQAVAAMGGNASLRGSRFTAYFESGRLAGIEEEGGLVAIPSAASSYMVLDGKRMPFAPAGTFSVEGEAVRGLRCLESIEGNSPASHASMISDYFMVEDFPLLLVTTLIRYPSLEHGTVTAVPHEIDLFRLEWGERCPIDGVYPDGTHYRLVFADAQRSRTLPGSLFFLKPESTPRGKPGIFLGFPPKKEALAGTVTFTLQRRKKYAVLRAAPNAGFGRASRFQHTEELFSFYLGTSGDRPRLPPDFPAKVLREMPRHRWRRID